MALTLTSPLLLLWAYLMTCLREITLPHPPEKDRDILEFFVWQMTTVPWHPSSTAFRNSHLQRTESQIDVTSLFVDMTGDTPFYTTHEITARK